MTEPSINKAQQIFEQTVDLSPSDRLNALDEACRDDTQLRKQVDSLLKANDKAGEFMGSPTVDHVAAYSEPAEQAGTTIGRYKLLEKIGQGGFGDVYMAQQQEPVKRRVAFKIIKLGMDTKQVIARFEAERQALALMDHTNIANVLDGGETTSGRPYFVMELVRGDPITEYCDREKLPTKERLALFKQVCAAIQHAHQKGVIHRDIKPNNVLVTVADGQPLVKVIDFGIAKATTTELTDKTLFTEFRQLIGTPQYMSPEQAERSGVDIDTRSDVYSLGVLLYEMLTGRTPVDLTSMKAAVWEDLQRMIREDEPTPPSMLVTSIDSDSQMFAKRRGTEPTRLGNLLKGDLDWIVLKALEKDRTRRYGTATALAEDIDRYLNDDAVTATPPSAGYKFKKFVRKNRAAFAVASAVAAALLLGLIGTSITSMWALQARNIARVERDRAQSALQEAESAKKAALDANLRSEQQASRAIRMAAMVASNSFEDGAEKELVDAWLADLTEAATTGELTAKEILTQKCQLALWWQAHNGGSEAADMIEDIYDEAKSKLGFSHPNFVALVNAHIISHLNDYPPSKVADLFGDLVEAMRRTQPNAYLSLYPQHAAALSNADRTEEATKVIDEYLDQRNSTQPNPPSPTFEAMRLESSLKELAKWGESHPKRMTQLTELQQHFAGNGESPFTVSREQKARGRQIWEGTLDVGEAKLRLRFDIQNSDGVFSGKLISLDQNNQKIPLSSMSFEDGTVRMKFDAAQAEFVGKANADNTECVGTWKQLDKEYDLTIRRIGK